MLKTSPLSDQRFFKPRHAYTLVILLVAAVLAVGFWQYSKKPVPVSTETPQYADKLYVTFLDIVDAKIRDGFAVHFSQPVEAHHLKEFWQISPNIPGQFSQGYNSSEIWFIPDGNLESGINYTVTLKAGLTSTPGGKLVEDYTKTLSINFSADDFKIVKQGRFALLQSTSIEGLEDVRTQVGSNVKNPILKIYKTTDPEFVIRDLANTIAARWGTNGIPNYKTDTAKLKLVATQENMNRDTLISLPKQAGIYLLQTFNGEDVRSQTWITVNTFGVHFRQDDQKFIIAVQDIRTGKTVTNKLDIATYTTKDGIVKRTGQFSTQLSDTGIAGFPLEYPKNIDILVAIIGDEYMLVSVNMAGSLAEIGVYENLNNSWQGFLYTDRPIYKTNDTLKFRGVMRIDNDGIYRLPTNGTKVKLFLYGEMYNELNRHPPQTITLDDRGVFFGEWKISDKMPAGKYYLQMGIPDNDNLRVSPAWFEILDYKKPPFEMTVKTDRDEYIEGEQIRINIKGSRFDGKTFGKEKLTYKIYGLDYYETEKNVYNKSFQLNGWGGMCGGTWGPYDTYYGELIEDEKEITLNDKGETGLTFDSKGLTKNTSQQLTFVIEKQDANGNTITDARPVVVHNGEINIFLRAFKTQPKTAASPTAVFAAETLIGEKLGNQKFDYTIEQVRYEYNNTDNLPLEQKRIAKPLTSGQVTTNEQGVGEFTVTSLEKMDAEFDNVEVSVKKRDNRGNTVTGSQSLYVYGSDYQYELPTLLNITSNQTNLVPGQKAQLKITAPDNLRALLAFERGRIYDNQWLDLKKGENIYEFIVKDEYTPTITPTFSAFYKNHYYNEGITFNVPAMNKLLNITATTDKPEYDKSQVAKVTVKITDAKNQPVSANLSLGVIDKAIFALRKSTTLPMHSSFYYFRPRRTNNSSSMTGVSIGEGAERGGGGGDTSSIWGKDVDILYWNPEITTNENGEATVYFPVSGNTVWKGVVYASDDETRVGQMDFEFSTR